MTGRACKIKSGDRNARLPRTALRRSRKHLDRRARRDLFEYRAGRYWVEDAAAYPWDVFDEYRTGWGIPE